MRERFCRACHGWHEVSAWPNECMPDVAGAPSPTIPTPYLAADGMQPVQSQLDGRFYDSKSALRRTYREAGVTEVGNDPARLRPRQKSKPDRKAIQTSLQKAEARFNRGERIQKA